MLTDIWHVMPQEDDFNHSLSMDCSCDPRVDIQDGEDYIFVFHNKDGVSVEEEILENYD